MVRKIIYVAVSIILLVALTLLILDKFLIKHKVIYASMEPNLSAMMTGYFLPNPYEESQDIHRGDIVLVPTCNNGISHLVAKRIVGLPGDQIIITDSALTINNKKLEQQLYHVHGDYRYFVEKNDDSEYKIVYDFHSIKMNPFSADTIYVSQYHVYAMNDSRKRIWNSVDESLLYTNTIVGKLLFSF